MVGNFIIRKLKIWDFFFQLEGDQIKKDYMGSMYRSNGQSESLCD
jgi:hypothetical protein